ncbi:phage major capsid protein [Bacillus sp. SRB_8]|uniref:phage major capsid protein n=1 Tax=unclassified Bacillus (in: firmicutes) TaxID=185979 RepID=UPI000DC4AEE8|nr:hypothetical protein [Bacillus sp. SRB_8]RAN71443.1 hypothetical protein B5P40_06810 [Bacillus sp. SRB_8]
MSDMILGQHPLLKKVFLDHRFKDLTEKRFIADTLFTKTTADALAIKYFQDTDADASGRYAYEEVPEVGEGSSYKRVGLSEQAKLAMIRKYGLEMAFSYEMQRFGSTGQFERGFRKLSSSVVNMVNSLGYDRIENANGRLGRTKSGATSGTVDAYWNNVTLGADQMINDIVDAQTEGIKAGYEYDTMVISPKTHALLVKNKQIRDALKVNNTDIALLKGYIGTLLGMDILVDINFGDDKALFVQRGAIGDIADADGGLRSMTYNQDEDETTILRVSRFVECYITDPKGIYLLQNIEG